jgi:transcriptional regulator with XRE-family HTH domain
LRLAQHVTAHNLLDPRGGEDWLRQNARRVDGTEIGESWFVAMRQRRASYPVAGATFDGIVEQVVSSAARQRAASVSILRSLAPLPGARTAAEALRNLTEVDIVPTVPADSPVREPVSVSPATARRRVRLAIREAREAADITQVQVARAMEWSPSKVSRIENGDVTVTYADLRALLEYLAADETMIEELRDLTRIARRRQRGEWWARPDIRENVPHDFLRLAEYEHDATAVRTVSPVELPDLIHLPQDVEQGSETHEALGLRRADFLNRNPPVPLFALVSEAVDTQAALHRGVHLRLLPQTAGPVEPFEVVEFSTDDPVVYSGGHLIEEPQRAREFLDLHMRMWEDASDLIPPGRR